MSLEWIRYCPDAKGSHSKCRRYSVCAITVGERDIWETWKLAPGGPWFTQIAHSLTSEEEARARAEEDAAK